MLVIEMVKRSKGTLSKKTRKLRGKSRISVAQSVTTFDVGQNYPNPFNPSTTIKYRLPENEQVTIDIYDLLGRKVSTLIDEIVGAGFHSINFDSSALDLPSGFYIYRLESETGLISKKMMLIK